MRVSVDMDATPEAVFDLYVDPDRRAEWNPAARSVTLGSGTTDQAGSRYLVDTRYGRLVVDVLEVDRPRLYRLHEHSGWMDTVSVIRFKPLPDGGCRVTADVTAESRGPVGRLLAPLMESGARWWGRRELRRLKAVAER